MGPDLVSDVQTLHTVLHRALEEPAEHWLELAIARCAADHAAITTLFPSARRACGGNPVPGWPDWSVDQAVRTRLLLALPLSGEALATTLSDLYHHGDSAERIAVLRALAPLDRHRRLGAAGLPLVRNALRTNDTRIIQAAMGPYAADHLENAAYRQGVLKCAFVGVPLDVVAGLWRRADQELGRMLNDLVRERRAAGRSIRPDVAAAALRLHHRPDPGQELGGEN
ncbi:EboA domain-containing protein [Actinomadura rudentiformis]|uniref:EboA domain-containing protein n=1 Tax=Actinomadura rudentiformis TaxID=359158 RepID=UPI00178C1844|nr:EboA domain-containing protein [Actinomadura rudentiformis]